MYELRFALSQVEAAGDLIGDVICKKPPIQAVFFSRFKFLEGFEYRD